MALSFASNTTQLASWGFSVGDIAAVTGAGRAVITWMTAPKRDQVLLDFLNVDPTELGLRKGLINPEVLNERWGCVLSLFYNGRRNEYAVGMKSKLQNPDRFSWIMTHIVVCLDQAISNNALTNIVSEVIVQIFCDKVLELEYLRREIPRHIEGWRSIGRTRKMTARASTIWHQLEINGLHLPGFIPESDCDEVIRFLTWMTIQNDIEFVTTSGDVFSLAKLLQEMGVDLLRTGRKGEIFDQSFIVARLDHAAIPISSSSFKKNRSGMRIPLLSLEDTVSLWPGTAEDNNRRREVFRLGKQAASGIDFATRAVIRDDQWIDLDRWILAFSTDRRALTRVAPEVSSLARRFLFLSTQAAFDSIQRLLKSWKRFPDCNFDSILDMIFNHDVLPARLLGSSRSASQGASILPDHQGKSAWSDRLLRKYEMLGEFQIFLLGYYYNCLIPIIDISQLTVTEAFGAWSWYDRKIIQRIEGIVETGQEHIDDRLGKGVEFKREMIMSLIVELYAGGNEEQSSLVKAETAGVISKLTVLTPGMLGDADSPERIRQFILLDVDSTALPSNDAGIINAAVRAPKLQGESVSVSCKKIATPKNCKSLSVDDTVDFTSHIEPAWNFDNSLCVVAFRHEGRLVHKTSPLLCEAQVLKNWTQCSQYLYWSKSPSFLSGHRCNHRCSRDENSDWGTNIDFLSLGPQWSDLQCYQASLSEFHGDRFLICTEAPSAITPDDLESGRSYAELNREAGGSRDFRKHVIAFVPTQGKKKARACIISLYSDYYCIDHSDNVKALDWAIFSKMPIVAHNIESGVLVLA